jgi:hypothetical protein
VSATVDNLVSLTESNGRPPAAEGQTSTHEPTNTTATTVTTPDLPPLYFQPTKGQYWREDCDGKWIPVNGDWAKKHVMRLGFGPRRDESGLSSSDHCLLQVQERQNIAYAAPLAGYQAGFHNILGNRVLVTNSPSRVEPSAGEWPTISRLMDGLFGDGMTVQKLCYFGWLHHALNSYYGEHWMPGQILALAGPVRSGKSLLIQLQTKMFGGRVAFPYQSLVGETTFNADLFQAEHLVIDDQVEAKDYAARRKMGAGLKQIAVGMDHNCHGKHQTPVSLTPRWRMTIALNDEAERLQVLPPLDNDLADKIMLLRVARAEMPMPTNTAAQKAQFMAQLEAELPAFVHAMLHFVIPEELRAESRFGIVAHHDRSLVQLIEETKPELVLLELVDRVVFGSVRHSAGEAWRGSAAQLLGVLQNDDTYGLQARELMKRSNLCGTYLTRLMQLPESRVTSALYQGTMRYTIQPPPMDLVQNRAPSLEIQNPYAFGHRRAGIRGETSLSA